jgi:PAS domain S-box-containing protein
MAGLLESRAPLGEDDVRRATKALGHFTQNKLASDKADLLNRAIAVTTSGVFITDHTKPDAPVIYLNGTFEQITGYSAEDALGYNCRFLQGNDRDQPEIRELRAAIEVGREHSCVLRNYRKDGTMFWNELSISPVYDNKGTLTNYIGIQNDVTGQVQERQEIQRSEERLRAMLIEHSSDIITVLEADGTIRYQSPASEWVLGYTPEELQGVSAFDFIHPEDRRRASGELGRLMDDPGMKTTPIHVRYRHADGSWRNVEVLANNLLDDPRVQGIVINSRDITYRKPPEMNGSPSRQSPAEYADYAKYARYRNS